MLRFPVNLFSSFVFSAVLAASLAAQAPVPVPPPPPAVPNLEKPAYPDSTSGLEHLVKDIFKAQENNDGPRADALLKSLVLPDARGWYEHVFGTDVANRIGDHYEKTASSIPLSLARLFLDAKHQGFSQVQSARYQESCTDRDGEDTFGVLFLRREPVPLYDLHLLNGHKFFRIFPLAYVDGGFRLILRPDAKLPPEEPNRHEDASPDLAGPPRVRMGANVIAARLVNRVQPLYPEVARREGLSGTVKLHLIIDKEGKVTQLSVIKGACSLAESALTAVRQWRYMPTLVNGEPVEVDTDVDVIFALSR